MENSIDREINGRHVFKDFLFFFFCFFADDEFCCYSLVKFVKLSLRCLIFGKLFRLKINYFENLIDSASKRGDSLVRVSKRERYFNFSMIRSIKFTFFF